MVCLSRPYPFKIFKGSLPQILLGQFLNTLSHIIFQDTDLAINPFSTSVPLLYPLETSEKLCFQRIQKWNVGVSTFNHLNIVFNVIIKIFSVQSDGAGITISEHTFTVIGVTILFLHLATPHKKFCHIQSHLLKKSVIENFIF